MVGIEMYAQIQRLKEKGYKKQQAAKELGIDRKTVRKYWDMGETEYACYHLETKERTKLMDPYRDVVLDEIIRHPEINGAIIYDHLLEAYRDFSPSKRTVRLYVCNLRETEGIPAPVKIRQYSEVEELPFGFQGQVDLGQKVMKDANGKNVRVYVFAMVLSCSRYKFVCFQVDPFTAQTFCEAHDRVFKYFGGRPAELVYDQDRVMVVSENSGDIIFTETFENYKNYAGFSVHLCRGYDPESKGKVEAVVKYVKGNFLSCRVFHGIAALNSAGLAWLDRTGNGQIHETTKMVPKVVFAQEQKHLKAAPELGDKVVLPKTAFIRKNNVVLYKQNRYCMPNGTYYPGRKARIEVDETTRTIKFFDLQTGEILEKHRLAEGIGKCVRQNHPDRDRFSKHNELKKRVLLGFSESSQAQLFIEAMLRDKPRYTRDQLSIVEKAQHQYSEDELLKAVAYCMERNLYAASDFKDTLEYFASCQPPAANVEVEIPLKYRMVVAQARPLDVYASLMKGGDTQ